MHHHLLIKVIFSLGLLAAGVGANIKSSKPTINTSYRVTANEPRLK